MGEIEFDRWGHPNVKRIEEGQKAFIRAHIDADVRWLAKETGLSESSVYKVKREGGKRMHTATREERMFIYRNRERSTRWLSEQTGLSESAVARYRER